MISQIETKHVKKRLPIAFHMKIYYYLAFLFGYPISNTVVKRTEVN